MYERVLQNKINVPDSIVLNLDDIIPFAYGWGEDASIVNLLENRQFLPPTVLLPRLSGEPIRADFEPPAHPRGTGHSWPEESQIYRDKCLRYPLPYAWAMLSMNNKVIEKYTPAQIITAYAGHLCRKIKCPRATLIIPNHLSSAQQDDLITHGRRNGVQLQLLWRPIAAALVWCEQHLSELKLLPAKNYVLGHLVHLHVGMDCLNVTPLEIVTRKDVSKNELIIPARRRPKTNSLKEFGLRVIHRLATEAITDPSQHADDCLEWAWIWASTHLFQAICFSGNMNKRWYEAYSKICDHTPGWLKKTPFNELHSLTPNDVERWILDTKSALPNTTQLGAVVTGSLAGVQINGENNFGSFWLNRLGIIPERRIVENGNEPLGLTARGATIYAMRLANGQPTYLDTLPRIKTIVTKRAEPIWTDLLKEDDDYVEGGKQFVREGIGAGEMTVPVGKSLEIPLNHEEYSTVREVKYHFNIKTEQPVPVSLSATVMPAQGNARLEVVPMQEKALGQKRIYARWETMRDTGKTPKHFLDSLPRICPPVTYRSHSADVWRNVLWLIEQAMNAEDWECDHLKEIRSKIQMPFYGEYPISSDGTVSLYQELLDKFTWSIVNTLQSTQRTEWFYKEGWRLLAHTFATHPDIESMINKELDRYGTELPQEPLLAVGRCVRTPELASQFTEVFLARLQQSVTGVNNWLRAFSELTKYRHNALDQVKSGICERIWKLLIHIFEHELRPGDASHRRILPYSFVGLAFLLQRRACESNFMPPQSILAKDAKRVAFHAQGMVRKRRLIFARGGQIDLNKELQRFIDYIDRRGRGFIEMAKLD